MEGGGDTRTKEEEENPLEVKIIKDQEGPPLVHISSSYSRGKILHAIRNLGEKHTDSAIVTNGMVLPVHSWVVGTFSKTLAEAFGRATPRVFRAPTDDVEVVTSLVNCMYRNTNCIRKSQLCSFLSVARQLGMTCFDTPALRSLEERLLAKENRARPGQPPQQQDLHSDPQLKEILKCLTKLPNLSITCKSQEVPRDVPAGRSQDAEDKLTPAPRQDEERCCCRCRCKKETGDNSCAVDERVDNEKEFRLYKDSLAKKLSTFGTTISGHGALINMPAHLISSGCISIKPVSTTTTNNNNNNNNNNTTTTTSTTEEEPELLAHFKTTAPPQRHSTMGPPHSNTPIYPSRRLGRGAGRGVVPSRKIVQDGARHGSDGMQSHQGLGGERLCEGMGGARRGGGLGGVTSYGRSSELRPGGGPTSIARGGIMLGGQEVRYKPPEAEKNSKFVYQGRIPKLQQHIQHSQVHSQHTQHSQVYSQHSQHTQRPSQYTQHTLQLSQHTQHTQRPSQHTQHTPQLSQHTQHTQRPSQHTQHTLQLSQHTQHTQRPSQHTQHTPQLSQHTQHTQRPSQHTQHTPQFSQHTQHTQRPSQHTQHTLHLSQHTQHTQRPSQHTQHTPQFSQHTQHTLQLSQHTPQLSQHTEHTPQVSQHIQHNQRPSQHTQHTQGPSQHIQHTPHNSRHSQVYSQAMQHTPQASQHTQNQQHTKRTLQLPQPLRTLPGTPQGHQKLCRGRGRGSIGGFGIGHPLQEGTETVMPAGVQRGKRGRPRKDAHVSIPAVDADVLTLNNTPIEILGTNLVMELNDNTFDIIEGEVTLPDCFATVNTATAQSQEPAAVKSSAAATPQQHMQLDTEEQGSAAEKDYSFSRLSFGSGVGSSSFEGFINNEDVQDSDTLVTVPSQPGPTSSVGQEQLDGHEGGLPSGPTSNVGEGQHGGHEGGLPSGPTSNVGQGQPGGHEGGLPSGPTRNVGQGQPGGHEGGLPSDPTSNVGQGQPGGHEGGLPSDPTSNVGQGQPGGHEGGLPSGPTSNVGQGQPGGHEEGLPSGPSSSVGQEQSGGHEGGVSSDHSISVGQGQLGCGKEWLSSGPSSSVAEKQQLPSSPCSSVGQGQLDSDKEEVLTGLSSSVEQEQQASPGHSNSVAEKLQLPSSPCSSVGQAQLDSDEDLPCLTVPSQELPLSEKNTKARREENHKCPTCHLSLPSAFSLLLHRRQHNGQEHFHCSSCDFRNPFRQNLEAHVRKKHSRKLKDTERKRKRAASVSPGVKEPPVKKSKRKENIPKNKRKLVRQSKRVKYLSLGEVRSDW